MADSPVFMFDGEDPAMEEAAKRAQETFRYFWRELSWESRRIIPGLELAAVKAPFWDDPVAEGGLMNRLTGWMRGAPKTNDDGSPAVEHMWMNDITFDGVNITGTLLNEPNWVRSVSAGDRVTIPLSHLGDWMYSLAGTPVCGAYSVNLLRSRMDPEERAQHDEMWGMDFGDPETIRLVPDWGTDNPDMEHPMSTNMVEPWSEQLSKTDIADVMGHDPDGWTILHHLALGGSAAGVKLLIDHGADPQIKTRDGRTAAELARCLQWTSVLEVLGEG